jgi:hypothetical protein
MRLYYLLFLLYVGITTVNAQVKTVSFRQEDDNIVVDYEVEPIASNQYYEITLRIKYNGENTLQPKKENLKGDVGRVEASKNTSKRIYWTNILQEVPKLEGNIRVVVTADLFEIPLPKPIEKSKEVVVEVVKQPEEPPKPIIIAPSEPISKVTEPVKINTDGNKLNLTTSYIIGGVGIAALGSSLYFKSQAQKKYLNEYLGGSLSENSYTSANSLHHNYLLSAYLGAALLVGDVALTTLNYMHYKKVQQAAISNKTTSYLIINPKLSTDIGIQFSYTF